VEAEVGRVQARAQQDSERAASAEARVAELEGELTAVDADRQDLSSSLADVEAELGRVREQVEQQQDARAAEEALEASRGKGGQEEVLAERDQLKEDVAAMKRKLMAAETALEAAASYKMKVAKLEAQLAQLRGAK
jgi:chromosome segregation ATPase